MIDTTTPHLDVIKRQMKIPRRGDKTENARTERLDFIRKATGAALTHAGTTRLCPEQLGGNLEAMIGGIEIPLGVAGPLLFKGEHARGTVYAPIATSEGALVSSITRGSFAVSAAGGVTTRVISQRMVRAPLFLMRDMAQARRLGDYATLRFDDIRAVTQNFSRHANLKEVEVRLLGRALHLVFSYETGDAAGQNMTTTCTWQACLWLVDRAREDLGLDASHFMVEGGFSSDKKVSAANLVNGRGTHVQAEVVLPNAVLKRVLRTDAARFHQLWQYSTAAAISAGMTGLNTNIANVVAGLFAATGQDLACVHESSQGVTTVDLLENNDLYMSLSLPSLVVGTVGGGTQLAGQRECLEMMGCAGAGKARRLAEVIAGFALALDLSTMAAMAAGHFAIAHEAMGRNRPRAVPLETVDAPAAAPVAERDPVLDLA